MSKTDKKTFLKKYILIGVAVVLAISSVMMTIETAVTGVEMAGLEEKEKELVEARQNLEESLVETLSLGNLQEKSADMGFAKAQNFVYITRAEPVARLP